MRTVKVVGGAASIEGDVVILTGTQENSDETLRVELPAEVIKLISDATSKAKAEKVSTHAEHSRK